MASDCTTDTEFLKKLTVLYVEDDDSARAVGSTLVSRYCGEVLTARNGSEGLNKYRTHQPHIVITDVDMPIMDGLAMAEEIRKEDRTVPIIVASAYEQLHLLKRAIEVGVDTYLAKPFTRTSLSDTLVECARRLRGESERRHGEKRLLDTICEAFRKLFCIVELCPSALVIANSNGIIEFTNRSFCTLTGYGADEFVGKSIAELNSRAGLPALCHDISATIAAGGIWQGEIYSRRKDGASYWEYTVISPLCDESGRVASYMITLEDITVKKQLTGILLPTAVEDPTGRLAGGLVHKLDNVLSVINGYGALLKLAPELAEESQEYVKMILTASAQASTLTHDLLLYCKSARGQLPGLLK